MVVEKPIQLVNILRGDVNFMVNRRVLIILEEGAQARLLVCDHAMGRRELPGNAGDRNLLPVENAIFDFYELEETHTSTVRISNMYVRQEANSNVLLNGMIRFLKEVVLQQVHGRSNGTMSIKSGIQDLCPG